MRRWHDTRQAQVIDERDFRCQGCRLLIDNKEALLNGTPEQLRALADALDRPEITVEITLTGGVALLMSLRAGQPFDSLGALWWCERDRAVAC